MASLNGSRPSPPDRPGRDTSDTIALQPHLTPSDRLTLGPHPALPPRTGPVAPQQDRAPELWWLSCHGGAGTSTLAHLVGFGTDYGRFMPTDDFAALPHVSVVLVCRESAGGGRAAATALGAMRERPHPPRMAGLVAVAAEEKKPSREVVERFALLEANVERLWRIPFVREYLAVDDPGRVGVHPAIAALGADLHALLGSREAAGAR